MKHSYWLAGFLEAAGIVFYISVFAIAVGYLSPWFAMHQDLGQVTGIIIFLLTFVFSALVCGALALAYPLLLVLKKGEWKNALLVLSWAAVWLFLFLAIILVGVFVA